MLVGKYQRWWNMVYCCSGVKFFPNSTTQNFCSSDSHGISKCDWYLVGARECWLKGPHQIPSVSWSFHHSLTLPHLLDCLIWMMGGWGKWGWLICIRVWVGDRGCVSSLSFCFFLSFCILFSHVFSPFI